MRDILVGLIGLIIGGFLTWYFSWLYYKKSAKAQEVSQRELDKRLSELFSKDRMALIKETIKDDKKADEIFRDIWKYLSEKYGGEFVADRCPACGSKNLTWRSVFIEVGDDSVEDGFLECKDCHTAF